MIGRCARPSIPHAENYFVYANRVARRLSYFMVEKIGEKIAALVGEAQYGVVSPKARALVGSSVRPSTYHSHPQKGLQLLRDCRIAAEELPKWLRRASGEVFGDQRDSRSSAVMKRAANQKLRRCLVPCRRPFHTIFSWHQKRLIIERPFRIECVSRRYCGHGAIYSGNRGWLPWMKPIADQQVATKRWDDAAAVVRFLCW
jgi:hypothetical protein